MSNPDAPQSAEGEAAPAYSCSNCGYSPANRSTWCALGCGSDYNEMIKLAHKALPSADSQASAEANAAPEHACMGCGRKNWVLIPGGHWACDNCLPVEDSI